MATVAEPRTRITAREFLEMDLSEGRYELVRGEVVMCPPPEFWHGQVCLNIGSALQGYGRETGHGHAATNDSRVDIDEFNVRGADVSYYREARWPRERALKKERPPGPPDLVVEVVSEGDRPGKVLEKVGDYLSAGVPMVWVADPRRRTLAIYRGDDPNPTVLREADALENLAELPGFACRVADLFA